MNINYEVRHAIGPRETKSLDTEALRSNFLIETVFVADEINLAYLHYDRFIAGGAMPVNETLLLDTIDPLKAPYFLERRELGIINIGGKGTVTADGETFELGFKEALYIGKGT